MFASPVMTPTPTTVPSSQITSPLGSPHVLQTLVPRKGAVPPYQTPQFTYPSNSEGTRMTRYEQHQQQQQNQVQSTPPHVIEREQILHGHVQAGRACSWTSPEIHARATTVGVCNNFFFLLSLFLL